MISSAQARRRFAARFHPSIAILSLAGTLVWTGKLAAMPLPAVKLEPFFEQNCYNCHDGSTQEGGLNLESLARNPTDPESLRLWVRVFDRAEAAEMPPKKKPRPDPDALKAFLAALKKPLVESDREQREVVQRRLNRAEYENTMRELFGVRADVAKLLPEDGKAYGFDNIGAALSSSSALVEAYLRAADVVIDKVLKLDTEPAKFVKDSTFTEGWRTRANARLVFKFLDEGVVAYAPRQDSVQIRDFAAPADGTYRVTFHARAYHSAAPVRMEVGGGDVHKAKDGRHVIGFFEAKPEVTEISFTDWFRTGDGFSVAPFGIKSNRVGRNPNYPGPGLMLLDYHVEGPLEGDMTAGRRELLQGVELKTGTIEDGRKILTHFLPRAFRRPVTQEEVDRYVGFMQGLLDRRYAFESALRVTLRAALCATEFLFLNEQAIEPGGRIDDYALASRLSYFLWSSMPDSELLALASRRELGRPAILRAQVERMLADPKAEAFTQNFTGQWLKQRAIDETDPDAVLFPEYDSWLKYSMLQETKRYFDEMLRQDASVLDFVSSNWTILNERLATFYGIDGVKGLEFRRVQLPQDSVRGGILTQASVLKVTANGTTTSPVLRGVWVIDNLFGVHVPPPPAVPAVEPDLTGATTLRQQLEKHRSDPSCAGCHAKIDPPGFALESFDPIGGWRERYRVPAETAVAEQGDEAPSPGYKLGLPVDAAGVLPTGEAFHDIRDFKALLKRNPEMIARGITEKLMEYGLGRGVGFSDRETIETIVKNVAKKNHGFRSLIQELVASPAFARP